jgi:hypothetical protein
MHLACRRFAEDRVPLLPPRCQETVSLLTAGCQVSPIILIRPLDRRSLADLHHISVPLAGSPSMSQHCPSLQRSNRRRPPTFSASEKPGERFHQCQLVLVTAADRLNEPSSAPDREPVLQLRSPARRAKAPGLTDDARRKDRPAQALRLVMRLVSACRPFRRTPVLQLERLSEHLRRDLGFTNHVEQPSPRSSASSNLGRFRPRPPCRHARCHLERAKPAASTP